ncbi:Dyp-type peroxidase [Streptomyces sp. XM83C]|jgi:deferrochelatase/peroxidase EfeB|uniref:Dyp-type peroxidase domain-containing protein n=1 Tax=unclassified Streptomyces TaxID=2593676 RepID=UPI001FF8166C|nr:Dyp-type peroxidase domain-containing protein [Streptomyces sp. XM83C]MCK1823551.1 Dyp-type peroxidase [Streptomyces sp. XM83C]
MRPRSGRRSPTPDSTPTAFFVRAVGAEDQGLIFSCFQRDLDKGLEAVRHRLQGEAMSNYTLTAGGGYFFVPPPGGAWRAAAT